MTDEATETTEQQPRRGWSEARRAAQARRRSAPNGQAAKPRSDAELVAEEVIGEAIINVTAVAGLFVVPVAPHVGFTIAGVPKPDVEYGETAWLKPHPEDFWVQPRAEMMGRALYEHAKHNPRILGIVHRFNILMRNVEMLDAAGAIVASAAVDFGGVAPDAAMVLPGGIQYPIFGAIIGDTIEYVAAARAGSDQQPQPERVEKEPRQAAAAAGGKRHEGQATVPGGVAAT